MKTNLIHGTVASVPTAYVSKNRQRVKQYDDTVYLNDGDEFEIELFNPTSNKVLSKIELNGKSIGSGIILRPGERVFLERYLDEARKFLFETYVVNGNNSEVQRAIASNGSLRVKFFTEYISPISHNIVYTTYTTPTWNNGTGGINCGYTLTNTRNYFAGMNYSAPITTTSFASGASVSGDLSINYCETLSDDVKTLGTPRSHKSKDLSRVETGRIEKGSNSDQSFSYDYSNFNAFSSWESNWKILPLSQKPIMKEDLTVYCTECGSKRKKDSFRFCPNCGKKF